MSRKRKDAHTQPARWPTLSLCMIVKNEEANLGRCLESVKGVADEIIVVDTGSTDRTVEIARQHGAKIFSHQWDDDFAAARNVSLRSATSDWILVLDADEALAEEDRGRLRALLHKDGPTAYLLNIVSPVDDSRSRHAVINAFPRLFRNRPGIRFEGRVHEQVSPSIARIGGSEGSSEIRVNHQGYHGRWVDLSAKRQRNIRLLTRQLAEHPDDPLAHFHLGEVYGLEGRIDQAIDCYRTALSLPGLPPTNRSVARQHMAGCLLRAERFHEAWEECRLALEDDPRYAMPHLTGAIALAKLQQYEAAIHQVDLYLTKATRRGRSIDGVLDHEPNLSFAWSIKGDCCLALQNVGDAEACYRTALSCDGASAEGHLGMGKIFRLKGQYREAAAEFEQAVALFRELPHGHMALAQLYAEQAQWVEAAACCERFLKACPQDVGGLTLYAEALLKLKRLQEAEAAYRGLVARAPSGMAYFALACLADAKGESREAVALCRTAWELERADARIPFLLGCCLIQTGEYRKALAAFLEAERLAPGTPEIEQRLRLLTRLVERRQSQVPVECVGALLAAPGAGCLAPRTSHLARRTPDPFAGDGRGPPP